MKNIGFILLLLLLGVLSISATKADKFLGKWEVYKMSRPGKEMVKIDEKTPPMWFEFKDDKIFLVLVGDGNEISNQQEWFYDDNNNKLYFITGGEQVESDVLKLTSRTIIFEAHGQNGISKFCLKKVST